MIIFGLDGVLADIEHRRHFIDPNKRQCCSSLKEICYKCKDWQPDYKAYNEACVDAKPIINAKKVFQLLQRSPTTDDVYIWSGRCESLREKTKQWIDKNIDPALYWNWDKRLKMRPIRDDRPQHELFADWIDENNKDIYPRLDPSALEGTEYRRKDPIEMVFESDPQTLDMFKKRGIFTFNVSQNRGNL